MTVDPPSSGAPMSDRMQSLLSRAAEDQLAEQRQLAGALNELRAQLHQVSADVTALRQSPSAAAAPPAEAALSSLSADLREAVRLLAERLDGVARLVQQRGSDLVELNAAVTSLQAAVRGHGEALGGIGSGLSALPSFGDRIGGLQDNLGALHERLAGLDELNTSIAALQQRVDAVDHGLRELKSAFAAIGARMAELPGRADIDAAAGRSTAPIAALAERLDAVERALATLPESLSELVTDAAPAASEDPGLDRLGEQLEQLGSTHREATAATRDRLTALEQQLDQVLAAVEALATETDGDAVAAEAADGEDPVLAELAELREALLGEGGIVERLDAGGDDELDEKIAEAVAREVGASEQRLSAHIDEAVLALADALLRRRAGRAGLRSPVTTASAEPPIAPAPAQHVVEPPTESYEEADDDDAGVDVDELEADEPAEESSPAWQTPPAEGAPEVELEQKPEDGNRRRRPWWRPGD